MQSITITTPDDLHLHVRDGELMRLVVPHTARRFARAIIMPNLVPLIVSTELARQYRERILAAVPSDASFEPLMTLSRVAATITAHHCLLNRVALFEGGLRPHHYCFRF